MQVDDPAEGPTGPVDRLPGYGSCATSAPTQFDLIVLVVLVSLRKREPFLPEHFSPCLAARTDFLQEKRDDAALPSQTPPAKKPE